MREVLVIAAAAIVGATAVSGLLPGRAAGQERSGSRSMLDLIASAEGEPYAARRLVVSMASPQSAAIVEVRSARDGSYVRAEAGEDITRVWQRPGHGSVRADELSLVDPSPPSLRVEPDAVLDKYDVIVEPAERVLGEDVTPLRLVRRADRRLVERLWVHPSTGVVFRRELYGGSGELVGMSTLLDMTWGAPGKAETWEGTTDAEVAASEVPAGAPDSLPYGYRLVKGYRMEADDRSARHWVYSDGIHTLSLFRTSGAMDRPEGFEAVETDEVTIWKGPGPGTWSWEGAGATWVVVAEESALDPEELIEPLPRGGRTFWARLGSWWARGFRALGGLLS